MQVTIRLDKKNCNGKTRIREQMQKKNSNTREIRKNNDRRREKANV